MNKFTLIISNIVNSSFRLELYRTSSNTKNISFNTCYFKQQGTYYLYTVHYNRTLNMRGDIVQKTKSFYRDISYEPKRNNFS